MHGAVQTGGRSPKPLNGPNGSAQLKPSSDNVKGKKREHAVQNSDSVKRDRLSKGDDSDSGQARPEHLLKAEISKITDKGGLVDIGGVEKLVQLMRPENSEKKLDLACRTLLVDVISATDRFDYLGRFVQLKGLLVLDEWLQEIHKGKIGDGSPKENDKSVEQFLFSLLCALDKLPVNLHALQTCNVGKSVNHLRSHKNSEIQKKAVSLVSTWKRRVEVEMNIIETKSSTLRSGSLPNKPVVPEASHASGSRRVGGGSEVGPKSATATAASQPPLKSPQPKQISAEPITKSPTSPGSAKLSPSSATKEGRSCSSSQSPNNSQTCSSASKISSPGNGFHGSQKEVGKFGYLSRNLASEKGSPVRNNAERVSDVAPVDNGNSPSLIVRLPNTGRSPTQTASLESPEDSSIKQDQKVSGKVDALQGNAILSPGPSPSPSPSPNVGNDLSRGKEGPIVRDEEHGKKDASLGSDSAKPSKLYEPSYSSINALVESCAKIAEASVPPAIGDDGGIKLLASVAAGEMSRSDVSPACSPEEGSVNMEPEIKPAGLMDDTKVIKSNSRSSLEEEKCPDIKPVRNTVGPQDAAGPSVKTETKQINEEKDLLPSSDVHEGETKLVTDQPAPTTSCGDALLKPKSEEVDDKKTRENMDSGTSVSENMEKDDKAPVTAADNVEDRTVRLDFDLNEVLPSDDVSQCETEKAAIHTPNPLPSNKNWSGLITVTAAAKGPFYPSEGLSRGKPELGWKGSAATSAFRPAEPRKVDVTSKPARAFFDFDLNVGADDAGQHSASSGLDLDLNACEETPEAVHLSVKPARSALPGFDLNGPGTEEIGGESVTYSKNSMQFIPPNVRMNNMDTGNFSTWFPPNNSYPAITIPSQRMLPAVPSSSSNNPEIFRGPVLSSSPAVAFSSNVPYQYSPFPFETGFSLPSISNTFSSVSNAYVNSSSSGGGPLCFPTISSVGPNGVVSMPYYMSLPGGSSSVGPDGRKWGSQGLDLNTGPGDDKVATGLRQLPLGGADEQLRMFHQMAGGGPPKRKEPDGGWDGDNRISYQRPHRQ